VAGWLVVFAVAPGGAAVAATTSGAAVREPIYTLAGTRSCLVRLPDSVGGLPPARPPVPPALFVDALAHDALSTSGRFGQRPPRWHTELGVWYGDIGYEGIILSFFKNASDARVSLKTLAGLYGGRLVRNVVVTWDQPLVPTMGVRTVVFGCLRSQPVGTPAPNQPRSATLATFVGGWGGHTRALAITAAGQGQEVTDDGCCTRVYRMTFKILSVRGTLTRADAVYRVRSYRRYESGAPRLRVGEVGKLVLRDGIVTNTVTGNYFCSDPAWGATGACGA
jgi:hypothetical protein